MGLETGTYINSLVATNPVGAVDPKSQGDNHLRLLKATILATFPNLTGAMTADQTELNYLDGATGVTGTGNTVRSASPTFTGTVDAAAITATGTVTGNLFSGSGASLTALNATNLASGTVPDARFPATLPAASGVNLTALNGSNIASGTVADARISTALARLAGTTAFSATQTLDAASGAYWAIKRGGTFIGFVGAATDMGGTSGKFGLFSYDTSDVQIGSSTTGSLLIINGSTGAVTTPNASASEVGFKGMPQNSQSVSYTTVLADAGKHIYETGASKTITIDMTVSYPVGTVITFMVNNATGMGITGTSPTNLYLAGTGLATTGARTLANGGIATALCFSSGIWIISGTGLS